MNDAVLVGFLQRLRDLNGGVESFVERPRTFLYFLGEARPVDVSHRQEDRAVVFVDAVDRTDAGVVQRGGGLCFA